MIFDGKEGWFLLFLALALAGYHLLRRRSRKYAFLLAASWVFYSICSPGYLWVILSLTIIDYIAAKKIEDASTERTRKRWLLLSIVSNLGLLAAFKYTAFVYDSGLSVAKLLGLNIGGRHWDILLPLGISFHTFQGISYTVDVYRKQIKAVRSFLDYALFVAFFPQLAAGPIVRAVEFLPQMVTPPRVGWDEIELGLRLFIRGLFKKLLIADQLHQLIVDPVFSNPMNFDSAAHRWAALAWAVQIYCDFSGYTDMALGTAKWFGFTLPPNFHLPYLATSITDFWRRWHISLSTWLRDYLYFPMGGSKGGTSRTYFNLMTVFVLCGLWHGAAWNWFIYGVYNGVLMCLHRGFDRTFPDAAWRKTTWWKLLAWTVTLYQLIFGLVLIRMTGWNSGGLIMQSLLGFEWQALPTTGMPAFTPFFLGGPAALLWLFVMGLAGHVWEVLKGSRWGCGPLPSYARGVALALGLVIVLTLAPGITKSFIYIAF